MVKLVIAATMLALCLLLVLIFCTKPSQDVQLLGAAEAGDLQLVKTLVQRGVPINQPSSIKFGWTPLIGAIFHDNTDVIQYLIEAGADVNLGDRNGVTPLMWVASWGDKGVPVARLLIAHGAKLDSKDSNGSTALDYARSAPPKPELVKMLESAATNVVGVRP